MPLHLNFSVMIFTIELIRNFFCELTKGQIKRGLLGCGIGS